MKFGIWNSLYLLGEASRDRMVTLSSRQPLTLHHLGNSTGENPDSSVPSSDTTVPPWWSSTAQPEPCSPGCLLSFFWISASQSYSRAYWKGTLALLQYLQINAYHSITSSDETSKWSEFWKTTPTNHLWEFFVSFRFILFLIYQPYFLPVPSLASRAFRFILAIRSTSVWLWHYVSLPWWWQRVFLLFWNEMVIVIVPSKVGDKKVPWVGFCPEEREASKGVQHLLQSQKAMFAMGAACDPALLWA